MIRHLLHNWWAVALRGVVALLFGVTALVWPGITITALILLFGAFALVDGIFAIVALLFGGGKREWGAQLFESLISIGAGLVALVLPGLTAVAFVFILAAWAVLSGVFQIVMAIRLRAEIRGEWLLGLGGLLSVVVGIVFFARPAVGLLSSVWVLGLYAVMFGVLLIVLGFRLRGFRQRLGAGRQPLGSEPAASGRS